MQVKLTNIELAYALEKAAALNQNEAAALCEEHAALSPQISRLLRERKEQAARYLQYAEALRKGGAVIVDGDEIIVATH